MTPKLTLLAAMGRQEGVLIPTARAHRNNNPGNIESGSFALRHGAVADDGRFAVFLDLQDGYRAMAALLRTPGYKGMTIRRMVYHWLGYAPEAYLDPCTVPNEPGNYPEVYIANVCAWTGLPKTAVIDEHLQLPPGM